ncbi:MAG TPA: DUF4157 domain-containing protein, partial [Thermoanaerobaculia bacterium]|nr:DUF4157 domain-containing protein [Thermoanaerobaculia bacterium]
MQRRSDQSAEPSGVPPIVHEVLRSSARPLDAGTREFMEPRFGHDFSGVRVHTDPRAAASAQAVGALAYTVGNNVVFGSGQHAPETRQGQELLAHELAHVVQQSGTSTSGALTVDNDAGAERQADAMARSAVSGAPLASPGTVGQRLQRRPLPADMRDLEAPHGSRGGRGSGASTRFLECLKEEGEPSRQRCAEEHLGVPAEPKFGEAETTSPVASNKIKPQNIMLGELGQEVTLFAAAQVVVQWAEKKQAALRSGSTAETFGFSAADLFSDKPAMKKLKPVPESEAELAPVLDLLVSHGVLIPDGPDRFSLVSDEATGKPAAEDLTKSQSEVGQFTKDFKKRVAEKDPLAPVVSTDQTPMSWSSDSKQVKKEKEATAELEDLKAQLDELIVILPPWGKKARKPILRATTDTP